jgi:hypothetical protein
MFFTVMRQWTSQTQQRIDALIEEVCLFFLSFFSTVPESSHPSFPLSQSLPSTIPESLPLLRSHILSHTHTHTLIVTAVSRKPTCAHSHPITLHQPAVTARCEP